MALPTYHANINYEEQKAKLEGFLTKFSTRVERPSTPRRGVSHAAARPKYLDMLRDVANRSIDTVTIDMDDIEA
eukprot:jgi/Hompol1/2450/HPOL_001526-RA